MDGIYASEFWSHKSNASSLLLNLNYLGQLMNIFLSLSNFSFICYLRLVHEPMFAGSTVPEQLKLIFDKLGTPTMDTSPAIFSLPKAPSPRFTPSYFCQRRAAKPLVSHPRITPERADLLHKMLRVFICISIFTFAVARCRRFADCVAFLRNTFKYMD